MEKHKLSFENPLRILATWGIYHLVIWTLIPWICNSCLPLDTAEAVMWGSQWEWGYDKHPPLSAWVAKVFFDLMGDSGVYLASQVCIVTAGIGIYKLGRLFELTTRQSLLAVILLDTLFFYQLGSVEFNVNYLQMPFWAWGWFFGINAVKSKHFASWIGLGLCVALGALTKYIAIFMLIPLFATWWNRGELKKALASPGLYIAGLVSILLFLPHLIWMKNHDWITITYGIQRGGSDTVLWWHHLWHPLEFVLGQFAILLPALIPAFLCRGKQRKPVEKKRGVFSIAMGAYIFLTVYSFFTGLAPVTMWAAPLTLALGLWLVPHFGLDRKVKIPLIFIALASLTYTIGYVVSYGMAPVLREKPHRVNYPGKDLARQVEARWHEKQSAPLAHMIAQRWLGALVNCYGEAETSIMILGDAKLSTYLNEDDLKKTGAMVLWLKTRNAADNRRNRSLEDIFPDLKDRYPNLALQPDLVIPWPRRTDNRAGRYGMAYIPPESQKP